MSLDRTADNNDRPSNAETKFDDAAFELFFKQHFSSFCVSIQYKFGFTLDEAKEVVHAAFIKLWENRTVLNTNQSIKAYIHRIIINNCLDILKHEKARNKYREHISRQAVAGLVPDDFANVDVKQLSADIDKAISELPEQMQKIFRMSRYEGLKYPAIAAHLNISVKTVETQISRALAKLREKLADYLALIIISTLLFFY